jgi:hypothetical protein
MREHDPKGAIHRQEPRPWVSMRIDRELLSKGELDEGLVLATPEQGEDAAEDCDRERCCGRHRASDSARVPAGKGA